MGFDNLFHRAKARKADTLKRKRARRSPYDMVLIVCEGDKTEPKYLTELCDALRLNTANIEICGKQCGSAPRDVVDYALQRFKENKDYDRVYCVFDKDQHTTYPQTINRVKLIRMPKGHKIIAVTSVPCFEIWLLLHYKYSTKPYGACHGSICDQVIKDLKKEIPKYEKGKGGVYRLIQDRTDKAISHAKQLSRHNNDAQTDNPSTKVHELVEYLTNLGK